MSITHHIDTPAFVRTGRITAAAIALVAGSSVSLAQLSDQQRSLLDGAVEALQSAGGDSQDAFADDEFGSGSGEFGGDVSIDENFLVDLHVSDEDLANVLQMLSIQSQRNIVASRQVAASITANLYGVTFYEALDAILNVNGYGYVERGNFIYVYTLEELEQIEQANRARETQVIRMNYLNATDAAAFATPLLSAGGTMTTNGVTATFNIPESAPTGADEFVHDATIVVHDYPENVEEIQRLLGELDTRPQQVLVEATILQTSLNEANAFGVDFSLIADINFGDFVGIGGPLRAADGLINGQGSRLEGGSTTPIQLPADNIGRAISSTAGNTAGPGTFKAAIIAEDAAIFLKLLDEVSDTTILSNPKILSLNRQPARVLVGRKVGYLNTTSTDTATTQTVEFLDTGTQLYFRPFVTNEGFIRMELKPQVSEAEIRNVTDATGAAVTIPDEITNELSTNVMVRDGNTIVLGGLFRETTQSDRRQVPFFGDIPLVGAAFRGNDDSVNRSEIIFMITPTIVNDEFLLAAGEKGMDFVDNARAGAREGLLPFSREKQASQLLVEAERLAAEGNTDKALHKVQRALALKPQFPQAVGLRERLMGKASLWPSTSMLEDIVGDESARRQRESISAAPQNQTVEPWQFTANNSASTSGGSIGTANNPAYGDTAFSGNVNTNSSSSSNSNFANNSDWQENNSSNSRRGERSRRSRSASGPSQTSSYERPWQTGTNANGWNAPASQPANAQFDTQSGGMSWGETATPSSFAAPQGQGFEVPNLASKSRNIYRPSTSGNTPVRFQGSRASTTTAFDTGSFDASWFNENDFNEADIHALAAAFAQAGNSFDAMQQTYPEGVNPAFIRSVEPGDMPTSRAAVNRFNGADTYYFNNGVRSINDAKRIPQGTGVISDGRVNGGGFSNPSSTAENFEPTITSAPTEGRSRR